MPAYSLHDRETIAAFLQADPQLHLYALGDLDDFFWPYTTWYASSGSDTPQVVLAYSGTAPLVVHALARSHAAGAMRELLGDIMHLLPRRIYTHLTADLVSVFANDYQITPHGEYLKMALTQPERLAAIDTSAVVQLHPSDLPAILAFYAASYPGNWFDPRMLESGYYYALRRGGELLSIAGVHAYSARYQVAALGNITTVPAARGRGLAPATIARLCQELLQQSITQIGLNVRADNASAIACYTKLGFTPVVTYYEYEFELA